MITEKYTYKTTIKVQKDTSRIDETFDRLIEAAEKISAKLNAKYNKRVKFNLELIVKNAVDDFYQSYSPHRYKRQEGLYKGAKVNATDDDWSIELGPQFMETNYEAGINYVYWNSFENGFHGGAVDGPDHPEPGVPWWKLHGEWYMPAAQGPSISEGIYNQDPSGYITEQDNAYCEEAKRLIMPYIDEYIQALIDFDEEVI